MADTNNPPEVVIKVSRDLAEFIVENCETNMNFALQFLQTVSVETARKLVEQTENFKALREATKAGLEDR